MSTGDLRAVASCGAELARASVTAPRLASAVARAATTLLQQAEQPQAEAAAGAGSPTQRSAQPAPQLFRFKPSSRSAAVAAATAFVSRAAAGGASQGQRDVPTAPSGGAAAEVLSSLSDLEDEVERENKAVALAAAGRHSAGSERSDVAQGDDDGDEQFDVDDDDEEEYEGELATAAEASGAGSSASAGAGREEEGRRRGRPMLHRTLQDLTAAYSLWSLPAAAAGAAAVPLHQPRSGRRAAPPPVTPAAWAALLRAATAFARGQQQGGREEAAAAATSGGAPNLRLSAAVLCDILLPLISAARLLDGQGRQCLSAFLDASLPVLSRALPDLGPQELAKLCAAHARLLKHIASTGAGSTTADAAASSSSTDANPAQTASPVLRRRSRYALSTVSRALVMQLSRQLYGTKRGVVMSASAVGSM